LINQNDGVIATTLDFIAIRFDGKFIEQMMLSNLEFVGGGNN
jgi:hypothetical protein